MLRTLLFLTLLGAGQMQTGGTLSGLVSHWPADSAHLGSTTVARDIDVGGHDLTAAASPTFDATGVTLNGTTQYLEKSVAFQNSDQQGAVCGWVNGSSWATAPAMMSIANSGNDTDYLVVGVDSLGQIYVTVRVGGTSNRMDSTATLNTANWYHICASSNASRFLLWLNGASTAFAVGAGSDSGQWLGDLAATNKVAIGRLSRASAGAYFNGTIYGVRYFETEPSAATIAHLYDQGRRVVAFETGGLTEGLVASWPLTSAAKASTTVLRDATPGGYELTLTGAPTVDADGLTLDGTQYAERSVADFRSGDSSGTIACWFKATAPSYADFLFASADEASTDRRLQLQLGPAGGIRVRQQNNDTADDIQANDTDWCDNTWHLAAVSSNGSAYSIYTDGTVESSLTIVTGTNSGDWFADTDNRDNVTIGVLHISSGYTGHLLGSVSYCQIFDRAFSATEHAYLYAQGRRLINTQTGYSYKGLVASWRPRNAHKQSATLIADMVPPGTQQMTLVAAPTVGADSVTLNGSSQYLEYTVANFRSSDNTGTILCWVTPSGAGGGVVISVADEGGTADYGQLSLLSSGTLLQYFHRDAGADLDFRSDAAAWSDGTEVQVGASSNGSRVQLIVDGVVVAGTAASGSNSGQWMNDFSSANLDNVTLGALQTSSVGTYLTGEHHGCDVFDRELSAAEIGYHYAYGQRP